MQDILVLENPTELLAVILDGSTDIKSGLAAGDEQGEKVRANYGVSLSVLGLRRIHNCHQSFNNKQK